MYRQGGNTAGRTGRKAMPSPEKRAQFIAESILKHIAEGRAWSFDEYGIEAKPEMIEMVSGLIG